MNWTEKVSRLGTPVYDQQESVDASYIARVEDAINVSLPSDYRAFLEAAGGVLGSSHSFEAEDGELSMLSVFFGADEKLNYDLLGSIESYRGRVPKSLLPIACDPGGNLLCLGIVDPDTGKVFFWDHEEESMTDFPWRDNLHKIADSFDQFIGKLLS